MAINIPIGTPAYGSMFFGYADELSRIWNNLLQGRDVALAGPRRSGKTSILRRIFDGAPERELNPVFLDACTVQNPAQFVSLLYKGARTLPSAELALKNATRRLKSGIQGVSNVDISPSGLKLVFENNAQEEWDWKTAGEILIESMANAEERTLFIIDEFGHLLASLDDNNISELLTWFRAVREKFSTSQHIRWLVSTDRSADYRLKSIASRYAFQDFVRVNIAPFDHRTAGQYLYILLNGIGLKANEDIREKIIEEIGVVHPYLINIFVNSLQYNVHENEVDVSLASVTKTLDDLVSDKCRSFLGLRHMILSQAGKDKASIAESIIAILAQENQGATTEEMLAKLNDEIRRATDISTIEELMDILLGEGIAYTQDGRFYLRSGIIRNCLRARVA